ncbi:hypothetical protein [Arthrobacter sp. NyZ413]|uniref:hypothetical protein n=1 Tax=Arthrobacter sp. NyZ413 TaxID=3144669 RepID=UPI003BF7AEC5
MLERQLRVNIDESTGHDEVLGNPVTIGALKGLDLVLGDTVQLLARNVVVDLRRPLTIGAVRASQVRRVRYTVRTLCPRAAKAAPLGTGSIEPTRPAVGAFTEAPALTVALATGAITKRLPITITIGFTVTVTKRLPITITVTRTLTIRFTVTVTETATFTIALTARTITKRLPITITEAPTLTIALTARTITKRLPITVTEGLTVTITVTRTLTIRFTVTVTEVPTLPVAIAARTLTKRLVFTAGRASAVVPGAESSRIAPGIVVGTERTAVATATAVVTAIAAVVLSHDGFLLLRADHWRTRSRSYPYCVLTPPGSGPYLSCNSR